MAIRSVATTSTLEGFRTTFNSLGTDVGDLASLGTTDTSSIVENIKGKDPKIAILSQESAVRRNACCKFNFFIMI